MRNVGLMLLVLAAVLGAVAVWGVRTIAGSRTASADRVGQSYVVVANRPIGFGDPLTAESLRLQPWPSNARPRGSFTTVAEVTQGPTRVALGPISPDEPVLTSRISGPGGRATLSGVIRTGMRASTIRVNDVFGVAGFVLPGDVVDVLVTRSVGAAGGQNTDMQTDVLIEGVRVLAVDQIANQSKDDPVVAKAATIEVTPEQAQQLALAAQVGTLTLALRGTIDPTQVSPTAHRTVRINDLRARGEEVRPTPVVRAAARPRIQRIALGPTVEIYRGSERATVQVRAE